MSIRIILDRTTDFEVVFERTKNNDIDAIVFKGDAIVVDSTGHSLKHLQFKDLDKALFWAIETLRRLCKGGTID